MKLPSFRRLNESDYDNQFKNLIRTLSVSVNNGFEVLFEGLNKKLSIKDNIECTVKDIEVTVDATGKPKISTSFTLDTTGSIQGIIIIKAENLTNSSLYPSNAPFTSYTQNNKNITINNITGLQADNKYRLRVLALG